MNTTINMNDDTDEPRYDYKIHRIGRLAQSWPEYIAAIALSDRAREVGRLEHLIPDVNNTTRTGIKFNGMYSASFAPIGIEHTCPVDAEGFCAAHNVNHSQALVELHFWALTNAYMNVDFAQAGPESFAFAVLYITGHVKECVPRVNQLAVLTEVVRRFQLRIAQAS